MNKLVISLTGNITETNFDEWKKSLLDQIDGIQKELKTDGDFALATDQAKGLKQAETALKEAKQSAIEQAADIQKLFDAIDEVSAAARNARLFLEGRVKARKQEIKDGIVRSGVAKIRALIAEQNDNFQLLATHDYTDKSQFEETIKGKRGIDGMDAAVELLLDRLRKEVADRATAVDERATRLARIAPEHNPLFQDRAALLGLSEDELESTITQRIQVFEEQKSVPAQTQAADPAPENAADDLFANPDKLDADFGEKKQSKQSYRITLKLLSTAEQADSVLQEIRKAHGQNEIVQSITIEPGS